MDRALSWMRDAISTAGLVVRRAAMSVRSNWGIGVLALVLATSLWVFVTDHENPESTGRVSGSVPIEIANVPQGQALLSISADSVTVRARASESVLDRLTAEDFQATVDLRGVTKRQATIRVRVESHESRATVEDVSPVQVTVVLEDVQSRSVAVTTRLVGVPRRGLEVGDITTQPEEAVVSGPESLVSRVESVEADIDLTPVGGAFEQTVMLQARGEGGGNIEGVNVEPETAVVQVEIIQVEATADFIVRPVISGVPADGYNVTGIQADPPVVSVSGPVGLLQTLDAVEGLRTEAISIDGATDDVIQTVAIQLPEGVRAAEPAVTVRVAVAPALGQYGFSVVPQLANKAPGLNAEVTPSSVQVVLEGAVPILAGLALGDIAVTLDLTGLDAGTHQVPVRVQVPQGTTLSSVNIGEVKVVLTAP